MEKRVFDTMKNGYNRYQVDDCVQALQQQIETLQRSLDKERILQEKLAAEKTELQRQYHNIRDNLQIKEQAANEMARMAMKEANMIVDTAHQNAEAIVKEALLMARGILLDIARLGNEANDLKGSMREELEQISAALDNFETPQIPDLDLLKKEL